MTTQFLNPGGRVQGAAIYGHEFPKARWAERATLREVSPVRIAAIEKHLQFRHQHQHRYILDHTSIEHGTDNQPLHFVCRGEINIATEKRLQFRYWLTHLRIRTHILDYSSIRHNTTAYEHLCLKWNDDQHFHFVCQVEVNSATEKHLQFRQATVPTAMSLCVSKGKQHFYLICGAEVHITTEKLLPFRHRQYTLWLGLRGCVWQSTMFQLQSRYNRTVCHLQRSGWLEVNTVEPDSTMDYWV
jgi:hypothetical protein